VTHIVLHTAEGATTYQSLGNYFANSASGVSSHTGIDDTPGVIGEYVDRGGKAWTASNANPFSVQAELCAFAAWDGAEWSRHPNMLANAAAWIAEEAAAFGLPIDDIAAQAQNSTAMGVCQHNDLGAMGGGHWDCGPDFPVGQVLDMARGGTQPQPEPEPPEEDDDMGLTICRSDKGDPQYVTDLCTFKTAIANPSARDALVVCITASGGKIYYNQDVNNPVIVPHELLDPLPETKP
jgi:hypothetical protein